MILARNLTRIGYIPHIIRYMSKERAVKAVRPGVSLIIDDAPHKVLKIIQGTSPSSILLP